MGLIERAGSAEGKPSCAAAPEPCHGPAAGGSGQEASGGPSRPLDGGASGGGLALTRRSFFAGACGAVGLLALGGASRAWGSSESLLRPPGAQDEMRFQALCLRCDRCRSVCPRGCIAVGTLEDGVLSVRTPRLEFRRGSCDFCGLCAEVCPTGAVASGFDPATDRIGLAVIDPDRCLAFVSGACRRCVDACPFEAIAWDGVPHVDAEACNGCGVCENVCPSESLRSFEQGARHRGVRIVREERAS